ncbi:MAG TPA: AsmA family protein, partial [Halothiobacillaceae bacterium]|nr:AsmA family protein [Halothiobacillaceae bacterium]
DLPVIDGQLMLRDLAVGTTETDQLAEVELDLNLQGLRLSPEQKLSAKRLDSRLFARALPGLALLEARLQTEVLADLADVSLQTTGLAIDAELTLDNEPQSPLTANYSGDLLYQQSVGRLSMLEAELTVDQAQLAADVVFAGLAPDDAWTANGNLALGAIDLAQMLAQWGVEMPELPSDGLRELAFSSAFRADQTELGFDGLELLLDGQTVSGDITLQLTEAFPAIRASLYSPAFSVNNYLPQQHNNDDDLVADTAAQDQHQEVPLLTPATQAWLRTLDAEVEARINTLTYQQWDLADVVVRFQAAGGLLAVPELKLRAFDGRLDADGSLDIQGSQPVVSARLDASDLQIKPLLNLLGVKPRLSGKGNLQADLTTSGNQYDDLIANLAGTAATRLEDGVVQGVDVGYWLRRANAQIKGGDVTAVDRAETDFSALTASAVIESGRVQSDDLDLRAPLFRVSGNGYFDLPTEQIDYRVAASVVDSLEGQGGRDLQELRGITIPVLITGRFDNPQVRLDMQRILRDAAEGQIRERIEQELDRHLREDAPARQLLDRFLR